ncbi:MAG: hypothetical protein ACLRMZ_21290 [Blautia marasmi]
MFSWEEEYLLPDMEAEAGQALETLGCEAVYQQIPEDTDIDVIKDYLKRRRKRGRMFTAWPEIQSGQCRRTGSHAGLLKS